MNGKTTGLVLLLLLVLLALKCLLSGLAEDEAPAPDHKAAPPGKAVLAVKASRPQLSQMQITVPAQGDIVAWQEASIGTEADGLRLAEVKVNVGDQVTKGQLLAVFSAETLQAELELSQASLAEAEALEAEAHADLNRVKALSSSGALSSQQIQRAKTAAQSARANLLAAKARVKTQQLRLEQSRVLAPDHGIISARTATVGAVVPAGQELFRLIRNGRLEWRAEVSSEHLARLKTGQKARITLTDGHQLFGKIRTLSPIVDSQNRNALVYVDLNHQGTARSGMFAQGYFELDQVEVMTLPQSAVQLRDGFSYVLKIGADSRVSFTKVTTGRRTADRIEISQGLAMSDQVVSTGGAFLGDGDLVRLIHPADQPVSRAIGANSGAMLKGLLYEF